MHNEKNNIMSFIMLLAAAIASIFCIIKRVPLTQTFQIVLITSVIFMILGYLAQRIIFRLNNEAREAEELRRTLEEQERLKLQEAETADTDEKIAEETAEVTDEI